MLQSIHSLAWHARACAVLATVLALVVGLPLLAGAEEAGGGSAATAAPEGAGSAEAPKPQVDLGRLLKLPDSYSQPGESRRGKSRSEWEARFETVRTDLVNAETALVQAKEQLGEAAGDSSSWAVAAPGTQANPENTPLSYKLRQEIRRQRENLKRAERQLRALEIEADLAGVPPSWRATHIGSSPEERPEISIRGTGLGEAQ